MSQSEHFIPGKDAALETTIARLQDRLAELGLEVEEQCWLNSVENVWSVHLANKHCPLIYVNGKGASELAARASALGEFFERVGNNYFWSHYYLGADIARRDTVFFPQERWFALEDGDHWPEGLLNRELKALYNPEGAIPASMLVELNSGNRERGICTLPYLRERDGATTWFPINIIGNLYVSNGMAAGNTAPEARTQALSEIVERYVKFKVLREGLCLPDVPQETIDRYPAIAAGIRGLRDAGFGILVKDASLGGQFPVMNVTLLNHRDQGVFASFGAHPRFEIALERALTELLQGRALAQLDGFPEPGFDMDEVADPQNLEIHFVDSSGVIAWRFFGDTPDFDFHHWNFSQTTTDDYAWITDCIHRAGYDIYCADFDHLGVYACRILVPGMSEIYPLEELEWENNSVGNTLRPYLLRLPSLNLAECRDLLDLLDSLGLDDLRPVPALIGVAADADSAWKELRIGELKTLLALALSDEDGIREGCDWIRHLRHMPPARHKVYRAIAALLDLQGDAEHSLTLLYGVDTVAQAKRVLSGETRFFGLNELGANIEHSRLHQSLLAEYRKLWP
ncbi:30S ribosomal protein S12 methylthiotransferase accessory factor YcaO [Paludibacterium purpuratum]|uniref:Ribosomal protein S12 methylthiotransferase accessory factor n=1 Tax=Paludibacterium purpuratum TaxID=1144873 RepID=A0A4R7AWX8_9NEIS|nr:30S ribosomal protein S12 methylthiotransferase accessory factor YcaO [Paludibacterium purpuratum]TDR72034.1 ribosomal protein S12 methylthiotransferase accessory factor [Paludibacterium purpuratum]